MCSSVSLHDKTRKRFSEKTIVAFTNSTVFMLDFYMNKPVWSQFWASGALKRLYKIYYWCPLL